MILEWNVAWMFLQIHFHEIWSFSFTQTELWTSQSSLEHFNSLLLRLLPLQNISSWDKLSYEQKGDSYMRTVQKDWLNQKKKVSISIQFNEVRDEYNIKFVFGHFHGKPKSFGDSPIGRWVTGRTDAMALTSRRRSSLQTIHAEVRQNLAIRKSASALRCEANKRYTVLVNFYTGRNKMIPPKVWDPERAVTSQRIPGASLISSPGLEEGEGRARICRSPAGSIHTQAPQQIHCQSWEGYFANVKGYRLQVTLFKM